MAQAVQEHSAHREAKADYLLVFHRQMYGDEDDRKAIAALRVVPLLPVQTDWLARKSERILLDGFAPPAPLLCAKGKAGHPTVLKCAHVQFPPLPFPRG